MSRRSRAALAASFVAVVVAAGSGPARAGGVAQPIRHSLGVRGGAVVCAVEDPSLCWVDDSHLEERSEPEKASLRLTDVSDEVTCFGDGRSGPRIQVIAVSTLGSGTTVPTDFFRRVAAETASVFEQSARLHGGPLVTPRFVHDAACRPVVESVTIPGGRLTDGFFGVTGWLAENGYDRSNRKYLLFVDGTVAGVCGLGSFYADDRPGLGNMSEWHAGYAYLAEPCWNSYTAAHELAHNLGAVAPGAPHATPGGHCTEEQDIMCYDDGTLGGQGMSTSCPEEGEDFLDCGGDDYFDPSPGVGSYLDNHWNTARSRFLGPVSGEESSHDVVMSLHAPHRLLIDSDTADITVEAALFDWDDGWIDPRASRADWDGDFLWETDLPHAAELALGSEVSDGPIGWCEGACLTATAPHGSYRVGVSTTYDGRTYSASAEIAVGDQVVAPPRPPAPSPAFTDVPAQHVFAADIRLLAEAGITRGCDPPGDTRFCPERSVTRGEMAAFLVRALELETDADVSLTDTAGSVFGAEIGALYASGITRGCDPPDNTRFCPDAPVTRGEMAAFLRRALPGLPLAAAEATLLDVGGSVFNADIHWLQRAGVTRGCNPPDNTHFCPEGNVTRGQMAAFLVRAGLAG